MVKNCSNKTIIVMLIFVLIFPSLTVFSPVKKVYGPAALTYLTTIIQPGIDLSVNGSSVLNNSQTAFNNTEIAEISASGNFMAFEWLVSGNHNHSTPIYRLMDINYTLTALSITTGADDTGAVFLIIAIVVAFILIFVLVFRRK